MKSKIKKYLIQLTSEAAFLLLGITMGFYAYEWQLHTALTMAAGVLSYELGRLLQSASIVWMSGGTPCISFVRK